MAKLVRLKVPVGHDKKTKTVLILCEPHEARKVNDIMVSMMRTGQQFQNRNQIQEFIRTGQIPDQFRVLIEVVETQPVNPELQFFRGPFYRGLDRGQRPDLTIV